MRSQQQAMKRAKNQQFLLLGFYQTVTLSMEVSQIQFCQLNLAIVETPLLE
jgi:hypothetical protein